MGAEISNTRYHESAKDLTNIYISTLATYGRAEIGKYQNTSKHTGEISILDMVMSVAITHYSVTHNVLSMTTSPSNHFAQNPKA